jgi:hypothetical protein
MKALAVGLAVLFSMFESAAGAQDLSALYQSRAIVTGTGEINRQIGFGICLDSVLVRVSGNQAVLKNTKLSALHDKAGSFVAEFRYRDRLEGIPIHDEQGTHDRPHDLTCIYKPVTLDPLLASLGARPWVGARPRLLVLLATRNGAKHFALTADGSDGFYMRDSFAAAAEPMAMTVTFPTTDQLDTAGLTDAALPSAGLATLDRLARTAGADQALTGSIVWSDKDLGWVADWRLGFMGRDYAWQVRGVSFDEAFRVAIKGAAQILSGNGQP